MMRSGLVDASIGSAGTSVVGEEEAEKKIA
jgi:hypothetical protein